MNESALPARLDFVARLATMLLAVVYASGFVIVTVYQSRYGISTFDLLKPKILAAGATFAVLVSLAVLPAFRSFQVGWWRASGQDGQRSLLDWISDGLSYLVGCELVTSFVPFLFDKPAFLISSLRAAALLLGLLIGVVTVLIGVLWFNKNRTFPRLSKLLHLVVSATFAFLLTQSLYRAESRSTLWFSLWLFGVGMGSLRLHLTLSAPEKRLKEEWESTVPLVFVALLLYAGFVYPNIRSALGGGVPVPIVIYFNERQPLFSGQLLETNLLDENEHGYYVTSTLQEPRAYFVPRESVAFVKFERPR